MTPEKLKKFRELANLTQKKLAETLGVSSQTISRYETGEREIPPYISYSCFYLSLKQLTQDQRMELSAK